MTSRFLTINYNCEAFIFFPILGIFIYKYAFSYKYPQTVQICTLLKKNRVNLDQKNLWVTIFMSLVLSQVEIVSD